MNNMTESIRGEMENQEDLYICKDSGITGLEIGIFAEFSVPGYLRPENRKEYFELMENGEIDGADLRWYGRNETEIAAFMNKHFNSCGDCGSRYKSNLILCMVIKYIRKNPEMKKSLGARFRN